MERLSEERTAKGGRSEREMLREAVKMEEREKLVKNEGTEIEKGKEGLNEDKYGKRMAGEKVM